MTDNRTMKTKATAKAVAFTGHREISHIHQEQVRERLKEAVLQAIRQGERTSSTAAWHSAST